MDYLVRLTQIHESFRLPELKALSDLAGVEIEIVSYTEDSPFCIIRFPQCQSSADAAAAAARRFISRAILAHSIYELWGQATSGEHHDLHESVQRTTSHLWPQYQHCSFAFSARAFNSTLSASQQRERINAFRYLDFKGQVDLKRPEQQFAVFEEYEFISTHVAIPPSDDRKPKRMFLGRWLGDSSRHLVEKHDLKKRPYISTTSMDAELALVTANLALADAGKIFYDPFMGTGGFPVAAAEFGAMVMGSDIDGRSFRGKDGKKEDKTPRKKLNGEPIPKKPLKGIDKGIGRNMIKYGIRDRLIDCFTSDLTNTPLLIRPPRTSDPSSNQPSHRLANGWLNGIISDPPYGVREGLKVLGLRKATTPNENGALEIPSKPECVLIDGIPAHILPGYIAPKKPYSFTAMLDNILSFAADSLVEDGRLSFWMPVHNVPDDEAEGNDETKEGDEEMDVPRHPELELLSVCVQQFNKWSRRLLTYRKRRRDEMVGNVDEEGNTPEAVARALADGKGGKGFTADDLNDFRRMYFQPIRPKDGGTSNV